MTKAIHFIFLFFILTQLLYARADLINETVYVESPTDTDQDGKKDKIYVQVTRPTNQKNLPTIYYISPYATGGNPSAPFHNTDVDILPQDESLSVPFDSVFSQIRFKSKNYLKSKLTTNFENLQTLAIEKGYATVSAHSVGTANSNGCPTVGDQAETLAAKSVIDWLNGKAKAYTANGVEVKADWANGHVGMTGVSYDGTLPNMVATTGVEGLKAIVPIAAISNWYDYYRANGLVVNPGGYIGEDADVLGNFIVRTNTCKSQIESISQTMGREHGDYNEFWQNRDYTTQTKDIKAAVFIVHGQSDWNVKQKHAIDWWHALEGKVPLRMWLHNGGHSNPSRGDFNTEMFAWFDRYVKGIENGVEDKPIIEVQSAGGTWTPQKQWPHESTSKTRFYLNSDYKLATQAIAESVNGFIDSGAKTKMSELIKNPEQQNNQRLAFLSQPFSKATLISGTPQVHLSLAVINRKAANISIVVVEYDKNKNAKIVTRGWVDPQNFSSINQSTLLQPGVFYDLTFAIEPKQYTFAAGSRLGVIVASTDYDYTLRPKSGTELQLKLGEKSSIELDLSTN